MAPVPTPTTPNLEKPIAGFGLPDVTNLLKIQIAPGEIEAILTVIGMVLRTLGLSGLTDFISMLIKMEQAWVAQLNPPAQATTPVPVQK